VITSEIQAPRLQRSGLERLRALLSMTFRVELTWLRVTMPVMITYALVRPLLPGKELGPPCLFREVTGIPCPLCGMTTSVVATAHLHLGRALAANPGGPVLVVLGLALSLSRLRSIRVSPLLLLVALGASWLFELYRFSLF
jgi:hypothetical protein